MTYQKSSRVVTKYKYTSSNQHGARYKLTSQKRVPTVVLSAAYDDAADLTKLITLGDFLNVPVKYDFESHMASIEIMSAKGI